MNLMTIERFRKYSSQGSRNIGGVFRLTLDDVGGKMLGLLL
jgi:hypothetical protein